jgi:aryl-alcohol dehydrogenase-like predicted oxidoreductase
MRYKLLGNSGLRVSELCLGTMTFGEDWGWGSARDESRKIFEAFAEAGGNFIDTANVYTNGTSEEFLGEFVASDRERFVVATKYTNTVRQGDPNSGGNHRKSMVQSVEASLRRLKTDYIDLLWLHIWDFMTPVEEVMRAFDDLVRQGKILYAGVSDTPAWVVARANTLAELRGWTPFVGLQVEYSLIERTPEREFLPLAKELGLGVTAWSPLASGLLTGKYNNPASSEKTGDSAPPRLDPSHGAEFVKLDERNLKIASEVVRVAEEVGRSPAQVALNWVRRRGVIPILGARKLSQFKDNLACLDFALSDEHAARLEEASRIEPGFPHEFYGRDIVRTLVYGGTRDLIDGRG